MKREHNLGVKAANEEYEKRLAAEAEVRRLRDGARGLAEELESRTGADPLQRARLRLASKHAMLTEIAMDLRALLGEDGGTR